MFAKNEREVYAKLNLKLISINFFTFDLGLKDNCKNPVRSNFVCCGKNVFYNVCGLDENDIDKICNLQTMNVFWNIL